MTNESTRSNNWNHIPTLIYPIRRVSYEEGIYKFVINVFHNMLFMPVREHGREPEDDELLITRASNITSSSSSSSRR